MNSASTWLRRAGLVALGLAALWLGISGCYPGDAPVSDIVATLHDQEKDFHTYKTFTLPDSVVDAGDPNDPGYIEVSHQYDDAILARIRSNLTSRGWVQVSEADSLDPTKKPDVVVMVTALVSQTTNIWYSPPYYGWGGWGGWWGYYPPYWGYPCCYDVTTYTTGTIGIDMAAMKDIADSTGTIPWAARLNGLANKSNATQSRIEKAIDQAFVQSPYLDISN